MSQFLVAGTPQNSPINRYAVIESARHGRQRAFNRLKWRREPEWGTRIDRKEITAWEKNLNQTLRLIARGTMGTKGNGKFLAYPATQCRTHGVCVVRPICRTPLVFWRVLMPLGRVGIEKLLDLWCLPQAFNEVGYGRRGNGWSLSSISDAMTPINSAVTTPPGPFRGWTLSQGNGRTDFDPRANWYTANNGMSIVVVDTSDRVFAVSFSIGQRPINGARPDLNGRWLIERLGDLPSLRDFGLSTQLESFEQQYIAAARS